jgi:hypothetical protein
MSDGCELLVQEMEDIIPTPKNLLQGDIKSIEIAVHDLLKADIQSLHDFEKFIIAEQKKVCFCLVLMYFFSYFCS